MFDHSWRILYIPTCLGGVVIYGNWRHKEPRLVPVVEVGFAGEICLVCNYLKKVHCLRIIVYFGYRGACEPP